MLSVDFPLDDFIEHCTERGEKSLAALAEQGWGRLLRAPTAWEDAVKTLCTTNASWGHTRKMCDGLCEGLGSRARNGAAAFPTPAQVLQAGEKELKACGLGYRASSVLTLAEVARQAKRHWLLDGDAPSREDAEREIADWPGFGPYATRHLLVLLGYHDCLPVDREVGLHLKARKRGDRRRIEDVSDFEEWGKFRFTAYKVSRVLARKNWIGNNETKDA